MKEEAISAGTFSAFTRAEFPKIQIITVEDLINGKKPDLPTWAGTYYKEAKKAEIDPSKNQQKLIN